MNDILHSNSLINLLQATLMFVGFVGAMFIGTRFLPGKLLEGFDQPDGTHKIYKLNGLVLFTATTFAVAMGTLMFHLSLVPLYTHFWSLLIAANLFAFVFCGILYMTGRQRQTNAKERLFLSEILSDLWFGIELNPTWLGVDLKMFA